MRAADDGAAPETGLRSRILDVAATMFAENGFASVSMRDICEGAGVSKGAVYHHFASKEALLSGIIVASLTALLDHIEQSIQGSAAGPDRLRRFIVSQAEYFERNAPHFRVATARFADVGDAVARTRITELRRCYVELLRGIIVGGIAAGEFADIDVLAASRMVLAILYWLGRWYKPGGTVRAADIAAGHADLMLAGVMRAPGQA